MTVKPKQNTDYVDSRLLAPGGEDLPIVELLKKMERAVKEEDYEFAAKCRDEINRIKTKE